MKKKLSALITAVLLLLLSSTNFARAQSSALDLGTASQVRNSIIFQNPYVTPVSEGVSVRFSASDSVLPAGHYNVPLLGTPFSSGFRIDMSSFVFNRGSSAYLGASDTVDLDFNPRVACQDLDIGAFEHPVLRTQIITEPIPHHVCQGENVLLSVEVVGEGLTFQWQHNGVNMLGRTGSTLVLPNVQISDTGYYHVVVTSMCYEVTSIAVRLDVDLRPVLVTMNDTTIVSGESVTLYTVYPTFGTVYWFESDRVTSAINPVTNITETRQFFAMATNGVCTDTLESEVWVIVGGLPCIVQAPTDTVLCPGAVFQLSATQTTVTARWYVFHGEDSTAFPNNAFIHPRTTAEFVLMGFDASGNVCYRDTLLITIPAIPFEIRNSAEFCVGEPVHLTSIPPADQWFDGNGDLIGIGDIWFTPPSNVITVFTAQTTHTIAETGAVCVIQDTVSIRVNPPNITLPFANFVSEGLYNLTVCKNDIVHLTTNIDTIFVHWTRVLDSTPLGNNPTVTITERTLFRVYAHDPTCGSVTIDVMINVHEMPDFRILPQPPVYRGTSVHLVSMPNTQIWTDMYGERVFMPLTLDSSQYFVAIYQSGPCEVSDTIWVEVLDPQETVLALEISSFDGCVQGEGWVEVRVIDGQAPFTFEWTPGSTVTSANPVNYIENLTPGSYIVTVTDALGATGTAFATIGLAAPLSITYTVQIAANDSCDDGRINVFVVDGQAPYSFEWINMMLDTNDVLSTEQNLINQPSGIYRLTVTDSRGCDVVRHIVLSCVHEHVMPSILVTPNNDGFNDYLYIQNIHFWPINTVTIINSYGAEIITIENFDNRERVWRGTNRRGQYVPDGTYWYVLQAEGVPPMVGWIIVRLSPAR